MKKLSILIRLTITMISCIAFIPVHAQSPWIINENFSTNENKWFINNDTSTNIYLFNNAYHISAVGSQSVTISKKLPLDQSHDYKIEAEFELVSAASMDHGFGISFGVGESGKQGYEFLITGNGIYLYTQHTLTGSTDIQEPKEAKQIINKDRFKKNKLTLNKRQGYWDFFINDVPAGSSKVYPFAGDRFGFFVSAGMKVIVHSFKIYDWTLAAGLPKYEKEPVVSKKFYDNFFDNRNQWLIKNDNEINITLNKKYTLQNKTDGYYYASQYTELAYSLDFLIEMEVEHNEGTDDWGYGLVFGCKDMNSYYVFLIADGSYKINKWENGNQTVLKDWTDDPVIKKGNYTPNLLQVIRMGDQWKFYVNRHLVTTTRAQSGFGKYIGVEVREKQKISVNYIKAASLNFPE